MPRRFSVFSFVLMLLLAGAWAFHNGVPVYYSIAEQSIKTIQQSKLLSSQPTVATFVFHLSKTEFETALRDKGKELFLDKTWYDIVSVTHHADGSVTCNAVKDKRETRLAKWSDSSNQHEAGKKLAVGFSYWWLIHQKPDFAASFQKILPLGARVFCLAKATPLLSGFVASCLRPPGENV